MLSPDWTDPGPHEAAPGLFRIPLPLPLPGLTAVNCYAAVGVDGVVLVDPGWATAESENEIRRALAQLGHKLDDITYCIATHHHWDHYSQAYEWRTSLGSRLAIGREERHSILGFTDTGDRFPVHVERLREEGIDDLAAVVAAGPNPESEAGIQYGPPDEWLADGEQIPLREGAFDVIATPGHTRGHIVLRHTSSGALITGDHVLPRITPSIGFEWAPEDSPLASFLSSMRRLLGTEDGVLLPAHGPVLTTTHDRIREQIAHHEERLTEVLDLLSAGNANSFEIAAAMPWTRRNTRLSDLPVEHQMIAVSEIRSHLDVLVDQGRAVVDPSEPVRRYAPAATNCTTA